MTSRNTGNDGGLMVPSLGALVAGALLIFAVKKFGLHLVLIVVPSALSLLAIARWAWIPSSQLPRHRVRHHRLRLRLRLHPGRGHATVFELWLRWGRWAAFRGSKRTRCSLGFWSRVAAGGWACSVMIGRGHYRHGLRIGLEEHVIVVAPPRQGKSGWLARVILHYPGPVISTTTKHDVYEYTAAARALRGPVATFNPLGIGGVASTFAWNPCAGCAAPAVAIRRADGFAQAVSQKGVEDGTFWTGKCSDWLRATMCAADLAGGDMTLVARWTLSGDASEAEQLLVAAGRQQWADMLGEMRGAASKTIGTIKMTLSRALGWLADPALAASVQPGPGQGLDIERFLRQCGILYLIAEATDEESPLAPLFACLATEIHRTAALTGSTMPGGRLDPPLLMALDEVTQICPVPLPHWLADSGGKGIQVIAVVHGEAQLRSRWGKDGARVIMDTCGVKLYLPGITDDDTLAAASRLTGTAAFREHGHEGRHSRHAVLDPEMISRLPGRHALVVRTGLAPVIASLKMVWTDRLYKRTRHNAAAAAAAAERRAITRAREQLHPEPGGAESAPDSTSWAVPSAEGPEDSFPPDPSGGRRRGVPVEHVMTAPPPGDGGLGAALLQLSQHGERLAGLDRAVADVHVKLTGIRGILRGHATALKALDGLDQTVRDLAGQLALATGPGGGEGGYEPIPVVKWWLLAGEDRAAAVTRLRSWVRDIYRPLYGHLAAQLGDCWPQHPLALMTFDWLSELWGVLYLNPGRTGRELTSQAELGVRILPAAAALLAAETQDCSHHRLAANGRPVAPAARS